MRDVLHICISFVYTISGGVDFMALIQSTITLGYMRIVSTFKHVKFVHGPGNIIQVLL